MKRARNPFKRWLVKQNFCCNWEKTESSYHFKISAVLKGVGRHRWKTFQVFPFLIAKVFQNPGRGDGRCQNVRTWNHFFSQTKKGSELFSCNVYLMIKCQKTNRNCFSGFQVEVIGGQLDRSQPGSEQDWSVGPDTKRGNNENLSFALNTGRVFLRQRRCRRRRRRRRWRLVGRPTYAGRKWCWRM